MMFDDYPEFIQEIILENIRAFCDNLYYGIQGIYFHSFDDYKEEIELYRYFSEEGRKDLINKLNYGTKIPFFYPKNSEEEEYLLQLSDYQRMILIAKNGQHMFPGDLYDNYSSDAERDEYVANYKKELEQGKKLSPKTMKFAKLCSHMFDFDVISEIQFKLAMSSEEWYLWMMMVIARFNDVDYREMLSEEQPDDPF
jgi:hypothetical protein